MKDARLLDQSMQAAPAVRRIAAMPSLHEASSVLMAWALWHERRWLGLLGVLRALAMGFALVSLGEHYLVDVLAGAALAGGVILVLRRQAMRDRLLRAVC